MCIILASTAHPTYPLILLSNRDEFLSRPTSPAAWWPPPHDYILSGRDLQASAHGTWLGITRHGRLAALTNFRDPHAPETRSAAGTTPALRSRGEITRALLTANEADDRAEAVAAQADRFLAQQEGAFAELGGFSCVFGRVRARARGGVEVAVISNRTRGAEGVVWVREETWGLSNSHFGDRAWPKVVRGEEMLRDAVRLDVARGGREEFVEELFGVLTVDTLPRRKEGEEWSEYSGQLRNSVFIPPVGENEPQREASSAGESSTRDRYGTQKQTVILVGNDGKVTFTEKTLFDDSARPVNGDDSVRRFEFQIEGWND